ncbi:hypothetical protein HBI56_182490 [Parastagonospora nodorum]|nr:hypothetical protein HBH56_187900 [Parastagonospora nodorum]KAH3925334.1 hypothetical protein HBH54_180650 [Parastagonospora nodorum]KAH3959136.1 hypothetical protein HBH52_246420 [Parastagonospora nodorum]KAH3991091.1 hypothetical protein HBI10_239160 [Parastagonospora nodorum]KAH4008283.1 hypothetical protein HBI13_237890 [Parastagonospora nodorum]
MLFRPELQRFDVANSFCRHPQLQLKRHHHNTPTPPPQDPSQKPPARTPRTLSSSPSPPPPPPNPATLAMTSPQATAPAPASPPALNILAERCSEILCANEHRAAVACSDQQEKVAELGRRLAVAEEDLLHYQAGVWEGYDRFRVVAQQKFVDRLQRRRKYRYRCLQRGLAVLKEQTARKLRVGRSLAREYQKKLEAGEELSAAEEATARRLYGEPYVVDPNGGWDGLFRLDPETSTRLIRRRLEGSCLFMYE